MSNQENQLGYRKALFAGNIGDVFDCSICKNVLRDPKICSFCGRLYCQPCLDNMKKNVGFQICLQCDKQNFINPDQKFMEAYLNIGVNCKCGQQIPMKLYEKHNCQAEKCKNHKVCKDFVSVQFKQEEVCSVSCLLHINLQLVGNDDLKQRVEIVKIVNKLEKGDIVNGAIQNPNMSINNSFQNMYGVTPQQYQQKQFQNQYNPQIQHQPYNQMNPQQQQQLQNLCWSVNFKGSQIVLSNNNQTCALNESQYIFKTVVANKGFTSGEHYWEIIPLQMTENELKVGVTTNLDFSPDTAFSDFQTGFSYYLTGGLRHGSNSKGINYGVKIKNSGVLGCYLNMELGVLSFAYNGRFLGVAYRDQRLKVGNQVYPAVSLLHKAGCTINYSLNIPPYFRQ
ncbi:Concanavalin A-like lectin/glucanases superfamily [Pseudocohnilembus persalinus]|uniref:Concanavalin A-like lectin/glucanases superfamily n=1 Tax=Pseudocohnilembus persalinus TaxID=266149 RepID=A0A0V0QZA2_PSEPJ|nr:Concanavalin A-like lectin/glucanases superfamily [Pseudocohnilembus persalinus]|eukprot:KRX07563.1 Concanavalin A-like lectin/glucanases superfamily [Pseudocohnilembus persalinus]